MALMGWATHVPTCLIPFLVTPCDQKLSRFEQEIQETLQLDIRISALESLNGKLLIRLLSGLMSSYFHVN